MRHIVVLIGGHASGKTTLAKRIQQVVPESQLRVVFGDLETDFKKEIERKRWAVQEFIEADHRHILYEGARAVSGTFDLFVTLCPQLTTFVLILMSGERLKQSIRRRKLSIGRNFTADQDAYWSPQKCLYEAKTRYVNALAKVSREYPDQVGLVHLDVVSHNSDPEDFSALEPVYEDLIRMFKEPV